MQIESFFFLNRENNRTSREVNPKNKKKKKKNFRRTGVENIYFDNFAPARVSRVFRQNTYLRASVRRAL